MEEEKTLKFGDILRKFSSQTDLTQDTQNQSPLQFKRHNTFGRGSTFPRNQVTHAQVAKTGGSNLEQNVSGKPVDVTEINRKTSDVSPFKEKYEKLSEKSGQELKSSAVASGSRRLRPDVPLKPSRQIQKETLTHSAKLQEKYERPDLSRNPPTDDSGYNSETSLTISPGIHRHLKGSSRNFTQRRLILLFDDLINIIECEEYDTNLRQCLEKASPDYITSIVKRKKDILKEDHGIVVAGETSAGKSTLINKILGMKIFKGRNLESTSTVCKIRNSEKVVIKIESDNGEVEVEDMSKLDIETKQGEKTLRDTLKTLTDMTIEKGSRKYESVDIGLPVSFLKGNTIIVDTPGIGGSGKVSQKVMKYLSNAVSFIFVINVASAGGMQRDRLPEILKSIIHLQMEDEMPCFDPRSVIFITNKWDSIQRDSDDSSDEDEVQKTRKKVTDSIYRNWPSIREENIFEMNLKDVYRVEKSTQEFEKFRNALEKVVKENENIRITEHFRYLCTMLDDVYTGVRTRQELINRSREEQEKKTKEHQTKIDMLKNKCTVKSHFWRQRIKSIIEQEANASFEYMSSDIGKERILNPKDWLPIMEVTYLQNMLDEEVRERIDRYVEEKVRSPDVVERFKNIKDDILSFYKEISSEIEKLENEWTGTPIVMSTDREVTNKEDSIAPYVAGVIATAPIWFPLLAAGFAIAVASAPVAAPIIAYLFSDSRKKKTIDKEYEKGKSSFKSKVCNSMEENHGDALNKLISKITDVLLQRRIKFIEETIKELSENREKIIANQKSLNSLSEKIKSIKEVANELKQTINAC